MPPPTIRSTRCSAMAAPRIARSDIGLHKGTLDKRSELCSFFVPAPTVEWLEQGTAMKYSPALRAAVLAAADRRSPAATAARSARGPRSDRRGAGVDRRRARDEGRADGRRFTTERAPRREEPSARGPVPRVDGQADVGGQPPLLGRGERRATSSSARRRASARRASTTSWPRRTASSAARRRAR